MYIDLDMSRSKNKYVDDVEGLSKCVWNNKIYKHRSNWDIFSVTPLTYNF